MLNAWHHILRASVGWVELLGAFALGVAACAFVCGLAWVLRLRAPQQRITRALDLLWRCRSQLKTLKYDNQKLYEDTLAICERIDPSQNWRGRDEAAVF